MTPSIISQPCNNAGARRKMQNIQFFLIAFLLLAIPFPGYSSPAPKGEIYLYGERHSVKQIMEKELELWHDYYHKRNMRHLFIEHSYFTAEFLNIWMQSDSDDILNAVYNDWQGTLSHTPQTKEFFQTIKRDYPETIFHGTDVGHQYNTTGKRLLNYLGKNDLRKSEQYRLTQEAIAQGKRYYGGIFTKSDPIYRENTMTANFIREFDKLNGESIMGIYGTAHTGLEDIVPQSTTPSMANQLRACYGDIVHSEDISWLALISEPLRTDTITVGGKEYTASYFGKQTMTLRNFASREFWRLENAYDDFKTVPETGNVLPYDNYPMIIKAGQVFAIDYTMKDGSVQRIYYRSSGNQWRGKPITEEFTTP